jgi:hypothetical protein
LPARGDRPGFNGLDSTSRAGIERSFSGRLSDTVLKTTGPLSTIHGVAPRPAIHYSPTHLATFRAGNKRRSMRILLLHHFPLEEPPAGPWVERCAQVLSAGGHEVRAIVVDQRRLAGDRMRVRRVVCSSTETAADLPFDLPRFGSSPSVDQAHTFAKLSDQQVVAYRDALRSHLDAEVDAFDPHVIHAQHIWIGGQLALETGVPYVLNAWGPELLELATDPRYRRWVEQAAENAGQILAPDQTLLDQIVEMFEPESGAPSVMPPALQLAAPACSPDAEQSAGKQLLAIYENARGRRGV